MFGPIEGRDPFGDSANAGATSDQKDTGESGGRVALPVCREVVLRAYGEKRVGNAPQFPVEMEGHISDFLNNEAMDTGAIVPATIQGRSLTAAIR